MNNQPSNPLVWRYATKQFDPDRQLSEQQISTLIEAFRLAPSSYGLQPWKLVVITEPKLRQELKAAAYGQPQITDASHLLVLCGKKSMSDTDIDGYIAYTSQIRGVDQADLQDFATMIKGSLAGKSSAKIAEWNARQVYLALGFVLLTAATLGIDACPMEGFDRQAFDRILDLQATDYTSVVLAPVGFRSTNDHYANLAKVRYSREQVVQMR